MTLKNHPMRLLTDGFIVLLYRGEANTEGSHHKNASDSFRFEEFFVEPQVERKKKIVRLGGQPA